MRGLRGNGTCAGTRTGENLREHPRKANVGSNRQEQKKAKLTSARFARRKNLRGYGRVAEGKAERNVVEWRPSVSGPWNTRLRKEFAPMMKKKGFAGRIKNHDRYSE